jgi:hypothetical protein
MKRMRVLAGLVVLSAIGFATPTHAAIISLTSDGTAVDADETNNQILPAVGAARPTIALTAPNGPNPFWAPALPGSQWVSYTTTGDPSGPAFVEIANGTVVSFFDSFTTTGAGLGSITVMADDSTSVWLDGVQLFPEASQIQTYTVCSDLPIGCLTTTAQTIALNVASAGLHTLRFDVAQRNLDSFGLNYAGSVEVPEVPEPTSMLLLGTGLLGLTARVRRRFSGRK